MEAWTEDVSSAMPARAAAHAGEQGIIVAAAVEDGPAAAAGLERGDILLELNGEAVNNYSDLLNALDGLEPGDEVELLVLHGDDERRLTATLDEQDSRAFLGVVPCCPMREDDLPMRVPQFVPVGGAVIVDVVDDSPADEADLEEGAVVLAVDGEELGDELTLADAIGAHKPGDRVVLTVQSPAGEEEQELTIELGEHPDREGVAYLGVTYAPAPAMRGQPFAVPRGPIPEDPRWRPDIERFRIPIPEGLRQVTVIEVDVDSPADEAGLREGDLILSIDGESVETPQDVVDTVTALEPGDELTMTIRRPGEDGEDEELELAVTLGEHPDEEDRAYMGVGLGFVGMHLRRFGGEGEPERWHFEFDLPEHWTPESDLNTFARPSRV
jgi:S1-C subfamily serine protease